MPPVSAERTRRHSAPLVAGSSLAMELDAVVRAGASPRVAPTDLAAGTLELTQAAAAELHAFWSDGAVGLPELVELASRAGALDAVDHGSLRTGLDAAMREVVDGARAVPAGGQPLASEGGSTVVARIDELAHSRARWRIYVELVGDLWRAVEPWWTADGVARAKATSATIVGALERGVPWVSLLRVTGDVAGASRRLGDADNEREGESGGLVLAVSAFAGAAYDVELPGRTVVVFGSRAVASELLDEARRDRVRSEPLARRLRLFGAPTRLAVLELLAGAPSSVGDLAQRLGLAQPTVSVQVKQLRDAGLVRSERRGDHVELELDRRAVGLLLRELGALLDL